MLIICHGMPLSSSGLVFQLVRNAARMNFPPDDSGGRAAAPDPPARDLDLQATFAGVTATSSNDIGVTKTRAPIDASVLESVEQGRARVIISIRDPLEVAAGLFQQGARERKRPMAKQRRDLAEIATRQQALEVALESARIAANWIWSLREFRPPVIPHRVMADRPLVAARHVYALLSLQDQDPLLALGPLLEGRNVREQMHEDTDPKRIESFRSLPLGIDDHEFLARFRTQILIPFELEYGVRAQPTPAIAGSREPTARSERTDAEPMRAESRKRAEARVSKIFDQPKPPILVHQMGKVGSTSVTRTLAAAGVGKRVFHLHYLSEWLEDVARYHVDHGIVPEPDHVFEGLAVRRWFKTRGMRPVKVITLVRDPVARQVSELFQNPEFATKEIRDSEGNFDPDRISAYLDAKLADDSFFWSIYNWFDLEIKRVYDIDVMTEPLGEAGWRTFKKGPVDLMLFRLEQLDESLLKRLAPFLDLDPRRIAEVRGNVRAESAESSVYRQIKRAVSISDRRLDEIYSSRFCRTFYTPGQIEKFKKKWRRRASA